MTLTHLEMEQPEGLHSAVVLVAEQSDCCMPEAVGRTAPTVMTVGHRGLRVNSSYRAMLCIRGTSHGLDSVRPMCSSVCPSVTSRSSTKTAKRRITQTTPHGDIPGTLVSWSQRSPRNSTAITPYGGAKCRWGGQNRRLLTNDRLYLENGTR